MPLYEKEAVVERPLLTLFPNPTFDQFTVTVWLSEARPNTLLQVYNGQGQLVTTRRVDLLSGENRLLLDSEPWTAGLYHVVLPELPTRQYRAILSKLRD